jgi:hypothetical protein
MQSLFAKKHTNSALVSGFLRVLMMRKKNLKPIIAFIISQEEQLSTLYTYFAGKRYKELKDKFKPWICLRELDLVATVSFSGYEVIRKHAEGIIPFERTSNSVVFYVECAAPWLLDKFGLWNYVASGEKVTITATVDGGELAWQLTQVSAGIKICDERAVNPLTGKHMFGETGYENVQSRYVCLHRILCYSPSIILS